MGLLGKALEVRMKEPVDGTAKVVGCDAPALGSTSSNYTLQCVVSAPGIDPQAAEHKGMAPVDKWPKAGMDLPIVIDRRHPERFIIRWDRVEPDALSAALDARRGSDQARAQTLAAEMRSGRSGGAPAAARGPFTAGPPVTAGAQPPMSARDVLAAGTPVRVVIVQATALPIKNPEGVDMYALNLNVMRDGDAPTQAQVGNPVPADCVALLHPGANLPAMALADNPSAVVVDWDAALAESR